MAYSLSDRFPTSIKYFPIFDPGAYQFEKPKLKPNRVPFLSKVSRKTGESSILWTEAFYDPIPLHKIPNISSLKSKQDRFSYEAFSEEDLKELLCKCGIENSCVCPEENRLEKDLICQGKVKRCLFKGPVPRSPSGDEGLSIPYRNDQGFKINNDGSQKRVRKEIKCGGPPFYDTRVKEFTAFYHGCKWSGRTSKRSPKCLEACPGPADYNIKKESTADQICAEKVRAYRRKLSRQPRFIEMVQLQNIREGRPGPGSYSPLLPKGTNLKFIGSKAKRFQRSKYLEGPGPSEYSIRRNFDPVDRPRNHCKAILPEPAFFGVKSQRFKLQREEGPSPATYNISNNLCHFVHCPTAPFGSSSSRFKSYIITNDSDEEEMLQEEETEENNLSCPQNTWVFKSNTLRMKPLIKKHNEPSPADMSPRQAKCERSPRQQYVAPFNSSEGRFLPWYNWIPVQSKFITPTPCDYSAEKIRCIPAFNHGPMFRTERFPTLKTITPAPNEYNISGGLETILKTHNQRLADSIEKKHKFVWSPPRKKQNLNIEQKEMLLLQKCIDLLEPTENFQVEDKLFQINNSTNSNKGKVDNARSKDNAIQKGENEIREVKKKTKLLRSFLYTRQIPRYF